MTTKVTINRLATGVPGLDEILAGGLPEFSFNLIAGHRRDVRGLAQDFQKALARHPTSAPDSLLPRLAQAQILSQEPGDEFVERQVFLLRRPFGVVDQRLRKFESESIHDCP